MPRFAMPERSGCWPDASSEWAGDVSSRRFEDRVAIITGATQGVGEGLAHRLVDERLAGAVLSGRNLHRGRAVAESLQSKGCEVEFVAGSLDDAAVVDRIVTVADDRFGQVDHLANCAALTDRGTIWDTTVSDFDAMADHQPESTVSAHPRGCSGSTTQPVTRVDRQCGKHLGLRRQDYLLAYCVSKGALMTLTRNVAYQLMRYRSGQHGQPRMDEHSW